jgi:hypothetical protein
MPKDLSNGEFRGMLPYGSCCEVNPASGPCLCAPNLCHAREPWLLTPKEEAMRLQPGANDELVIRGSAFRVGSEAGAVWMPPCLRGRPASTCRLLVCAPSAAAGKPACARPRRGLTFMRVRFSASAPLVRPRAPCDSVSIERGAST